MKKVLAAIVIVLALSMAVAIILPFVIDINAIVAAQLPKIKDRIHRDITIGDVKLTVLTGLGAEIKNVTISNHPDFKKQNFVHIDSLKTTVRLLPLLHKEVVVSSIAIEKPSVLVEKDEYGVFNFSDMVPAQEPVKDNGTKPQSPSAPGNPLAGLENIRISTISIKDGTFVFSDAGKPGAAREIRLDKLNLAMKTVSLTRKIDIDFQTDIYAGPRIGHVSLAGGLGPIGVKPVPETIPMDLTLSLGDLNLSALAAYAGSIEARSGAVDVTTVIQGRLQDKLRCQADIGWKSLELTVKDAQTPSSPARTVSINGSWQIASDISGSLKTPAVSGKITLDKSAIRVDPVFDKPAGTPLNIDVDMTIGDKVREFRNIVARVGPLEATVKGSIDGKKAVDISLQTNRFPIAELAALSPQMTAGLPEKQLPSSVYLTATATGAPDNLAVKANLEAAASNDTSDLAINARVQNTGKPDIRFDLTSRYLDVDSFLPPAPEEKKAPEQKREPAAGSVPDNKPSEKRQAPDLRISGQVSVNKCKINKIILENIAAEFQYADAVATLKHLSLNTFGGSISTSASANLTDMTSPRWNADLTTRDINVNTALSRFRSMKDTLYGGFNSRLSLQGKGGDWPVISKSLSGNGSADIVNGKLAKVNVLDAVGQSLLKFQGLSALAQSLSSSAGKQLNETRFTRLSGNFDIRDENILLNSLTMASADFNLSGKGKIGLTDQNLDLDTLLVLSRDASDRLQKEKAMRYLLNRDQQMEIPCAVKGNAANPRITADGDTLNRLMRNAATKAIEDQVQKGVGDKLGKKADQLLKQIFK